MTTVPQADSHDVDVADSRTAGSAAGPADGGAGTRAAAHADGRTGDRADGHGDDGPGGRSERRAAEEPRRPREHPAEPGGAEDRRPGLDAEALHRAWDDGLIARRARPERPPRQAEAQPPVSAPPRPQAAFDPRSAGPRLGTVLRPRLDALRELVGLSGARLDRRTLAEAGRVLEEAAARQRLSLDLTVVALAGATGSGKSTLFNALARTQLSDTGVRRPTTSAPIACAWTDRADRADGLLDRLGIPPRSRRQPVRPYDPGLHGLVLLDLPDHDSASAGHREQVDRLLALVDAVIWVVDPEKYADAVLHERYLRPLAGYAEVTFVVLNQIDRLSEDAADQVLDDLRRLLDEDGLALGEHGEPGATVLALSALTGKGLGELRETLAQFTAARSVAERRLIADVDGVSARLRPAYVADGRPGLTDRARQEFEDRLAEAVGAQATGLAAERAWLRDAGRACGTPWTVALRWYGRRRAAWGGGPSGGPATGTGTEARTDAGTGARTGPGHAAGPLPDTFPDPVAGRETPVPRPAAPVLSHEPSSRRTVSRPLVEQAVRTLAYEASAGLPDPWARAVREAAGRGAEGLADALDAAAGALMAGGSAAVGRGRGARASAARGGPGGTGSGRTGVWRTRGGGAPRVVRPGWWAVAATAQWVLSALQLLGTAWLLGTLFGMCAGEWWIAGLVLTGGGAGGPALEWGCRVVARGPARRHGLETERRLRSVAAGCGRERVLEPVAAELLRYREVRAQFVIAAGGA
ncbi:MULTISPECIES: YfjP family GTPase [Streptomyces]|uniref:ATP-binding protein n=1 Tax=Streptomyces albireticuli TaxID=1940 RepID=A0A1Z2L6X3_9ACTN|nr:YfjP family GTPase [Streptomyces albireticuli]ARZ70056.1 ATP-binding protein [Streptomyces albireticuli]